MKLKIRFFSLLLLFILPTEVFGQDISGNVTLYNRAGEYVLAETFSRKEIRKFPSADQALQFAIQGMENGGTIDMLNGNYELHNTVYLNSDITLKGSGRNTVLNVISTDTTGVGLFAKDSKFVIVSDFSIKTKEPETAVAGVCFDHCGDSEMNSVYAEGFGKYGLWLRNNSFLCHINACKAANNMRANIFADSLFKSRAGEFMPNLITNCITYAGYNGIETSRAIVLNIVGCIVHQPEHYGFYINNTSNSVLISGCRTYQTQHNAVVVEKSHEINISSNIFCWSRGKGIVLKEVNWGTISGNNVIDSGSERYGGFPGVGEAIGIELTAKTKCIQVTANNIFNWGGQGIMKYAILEDETCSYNSFTSNNLNYFEEGGVVSEGENSLVDNVVYLQDPALRGKPEGPDPLFVPGKLQKFIEE